ncbi:MAG: DUF3419 family protein [Deltaproteobacteria bacterium]|nr:DUF3419 family protein [Deltaproteobacteria bacterium]
MTRRRLIHGGVSDDLDLLIASLEPKAGRRFVAISAHGSGEAALALAALGASEVIALDLEDPSSLARLLELKTAAAWLFGREDYLVIMGLRPASALRRRALANQLLRSLDRAQRRYWQPRRDWLVDGLFKADQVAQFFRVFMAATKTLAPREAREQMLRSPDRAVRRAAFDRCLARPWLKRALALAGSFNLFFPEAEWRASEYPRIMSRDPLAFLAGLVDAGLAANPLFAHLLSNGPLGESVLPPQLRPRLFDGLRARAAHVRVLAPALGLSRSVLPLNAGQYDGAYLSNVVDYLQVEERALLFREVRRVLRPGAPLLVYSNEAFPKVPLEVGLRLDAERSRELSAADRAHVYRRIEVYRAIDPAEATRRLRVVS